MTKSSALDENSPPADYDYVIDTDTQIQETVDAILPYMDDRASAKKFISYSNRPRSNIYADTSAYPLFEYKRAHGTDTPLRQDQDITELITTNDINDLHETLGISSAIVSPTLNLGLGEIQNDRFAVALANAYNAWLLDQLESHDSLYGNLLIAPHRPDRAAEEIDERATESDIKGIEFPAIGITPPMGHERYTPIYEAAESHDLPIAMHGVVGLKSFHQQYYHSSSSYAEDYVTHAPFTHLRNLVSLLFEGIPEFYPELSFVCHGMGLGYAPYIIHRIDDHYLELGYEIPALSKLPSEYFADNFYWSTRPLGHTQRQSKYFSRMIEMIGPENILYASDLPHPVDDTPTDFIAITEPAFDQATIEQMLSGNAEQLYQV